MRNYYKAWNATRIEINNPNTLLSTKLVPKLHNFGAK